MIADELEKLQQLRQSGVLTESEFVEAKRRLLSEDFYRPTVSAAGPEDNVRIHGIKQNTWIMLMHLSQLLILAGGLGFVAPIVMWAVSKDESAEADRQGLMILNWLLSCLVYLVVGSLLSLVLVGIPILVALCVVVIVFPIVGAVKAGNHEYWTYPLTISFFPSSRDSATDASS